MYLSLPQAATLLSPHLVRLHAVCSRYDVAGSMRRRTAWVRDIAILCQPIEVSCEQIDLFGTATILTGRVKAFGTALRSIGSVVQGDVMQGRRVALRTEGGIRIDIYMPQAHDYYRQLAIRTGDTRYARDIIAARWIELGWVGTPDGLRRRGDCILLGERWRVKPGHTPTELPPAWSSEQELFDWLGLTWKEPWWRE